MSLGKKSEIFLREHKLRNFLQDIEKYRFTEKMDVNSFFTLEEKNEQVNPPMPLEGDWKESEIGLKWGGIDTYMWTRFAFNFPKHWKDQKVIGTFDFGRTQPGGLVGAETLLYVNGIPFKGVDQNHLEVVIKPELIDSETEFSFRSWSGVPNQFRYDVHSNYSIRIKNEGPIGAIHTVKQLNFGVLDEKINTFYYDVLAILETVKAIKSTNSTESDMLLRALDKVYKFIDPTLEMENIEAHIQQLHEAADLLKTEQSKIKKCTNVKFSAIGQTHIDVAWLWRIKHTREKIARSFSTALRLMDEYPDFIFLQSQPQLFAYLKKDYPTIFEEIKQKVKEGRFEVDGAMWLESDCNIPSGESLTRQILYGKMFMEDEFGVESKFLWMPDVFGYSWALPQILKKSGVDTFCTTKMGWNQYNRIPFNSFWWRGMDGTQIMTHLIEDTDFHAVSADTMINGWEKYKDKELVDGILYHFGLGDGGGGPQEKNVELLHRYNEMPGLPHIEFEKAGSYFDRLNETATNTDEYVHTWDGEFYLELHRGTFTSQAFTKKYNRQLEFAYRNAEILGTLTHLKNRQWDLYDQDLITNGWKLILLNQFHDIIPGSSIADVYVDALKDYQKAETDIATQQTVFETNLLAEATHKYSIFNPSNWELSDEVFIENIEGGCFYQDGKALNAQRLDNGYLVRIENMKPLSHTVIEFKETEVLENNVLMNVTTESIETPYYVLSINKVGQITSIYDKENQKEVLAKGKIANYLRTYQDRPLDWDCWDVDIFYKDRPKDVTDLQSIEVIENNSIRAVVRFNWNHLKSTISQDMIVYATNRRIDFKTTVDWKEQQRLLRTSFEVDIRSTKATYDIQYGNCERPTHWNTSWDWSRFEVVGHKWADLSESSYGVALMNDCKYGYSIKDNAMELTLIKSGINPDPKADNCVHEFTYSLFPHALDWREANVEIESWKLNNRLTSLKGEIETKSIFNFNTDAVVVDAIKKSERGDEVVLRIHEYKGGTQNLTISSDYEIESFEEVNLMEKSMGNKINTSVLNDSIKAYEIKTYKVTFKSGRLG